MQKVKTIILLLVLAGAGTTMPVRANQDTADVTRQLLNLRMQEIQLGMIEQYGAKLEKKEEKKKEESFARQLWNGTVKEITTSPYFKYALCFLIVTSVLRK